MKAMKKSYKGGCCVGTKGVAPGMAINTAAQTSVKANGYLYWSHFSGYVPEQMLPALLQ